MQKPKNEALQDGTLLVATAMVATSWCFRFGESELRFDNDGKVSFRGNTDEAAEAFFARVIQLHNQHYAQLNARNTLLQRRIEELEEETSFIPKR